METSITAQSLAAARDVLPSRPLEAERQADAVLQALPGHPEALLILGMAHRRQGNLFESLALLKPLVRAHPGYAEAHTEWGITQAAMGLTPAAIASLRQSVVLDPEKPAAWRSLGTLLVSQGEPAQADAAFLQQVRTAFADPVLKQAADAFDRDDFALGERLLRMRLADEPTDVAALRMLGEVRLSQGDNAEAALLLERCLALAPSLTPARHHYAAALLFQGRADEACPHIERLLAADAQDIRYRSLMALHAAMIGDHVRAIGIYREIVQAQPHESQMWLSLGLSLRALGRKPEAVAAYREAARVAPGLALAYWSLANLKTEPFTPAEIAAMQAQLFRPDLDDADRLHLDYALGHAFEQASEFAASFEYYAAGAMVKRRHVTYSADRTTQQFGQLRASMTPAFFAERAGAGCPDPAPIFVLGLPRSGSTLVEQILASHSQVEGTSELQDIPDIARGLGWERNCDITAYCARLATLTKAELSHLGELYIRRTRVHRKSQRLFFVDKMPDNFIHAGLIQLILPSAKLIDVRRQPMAAGFAMFKQLFARGQDNTYDLHELGRYWHDYSALTAHFDLVLPGRVHRVEYEHLVTDTEREVRRLLEYCGLAFEPACLRFHETARTINTASSEQVRQRIFTGALDQWRHYEPWLGELRSALGGVIA